MCEISSVRSRESIRSDTRGTTVIIDVRAAAASFEVSKTADPSGCIAGCRNRATSRCWTLASACRSVALPATGAGPGGSGFTARNPFSLAPTLGPDASAYLYILVFNQESSNGNATGLRVAFTSAYFTPE